VDYDRKNKVEKKKKKETRTCSCTLTLNDPFMLDQNRPNERWTKTADHPFLSFAPRG